MHLDELSFRDRADAGRQLARRLRMLQAPLDLLFVCKIGAPDHLEFGVGAIVDGAHPQVVLNEEALAELDVPKGYIEKETRRQLREIERRRRHYLAGRRPVDVADRTAIVVDDGIATGGTIRGALKGLARARPARLVLAFPVAPLDTVERLRAEADEVVCLLTPEPFYAVGEHYDDFTQTSDQEVITLLDEARSWNREEVP
jgi:putative phosphoribosyl transferase